MKNPDIYEKNDQYPLMNPLLHQTINLHIESSSILDHKICLTLVYLISISWRGDNQTPPPSFSINKKRPRVTS